MGEVVNLRLARKAKSRDDKARTAEENRARHGRTGAEKQLDRMSVEKSATFLDAHKRATPAYPSSREVAPQGGAGGDADASPDAERDTGIPRG